MSFSWSELHLIAYMAACRELSDRARGQVSTYGEAHRHAGDLIESANQLVGDAEDVLRLAVAAERAASTSWQEIGERLSVSKQAAHERFAVAVQEIADGVLFPNRAPAHDGGLGRWACPDGLEDPADTVRRLDEWAARHQEAFDPERGDHLVSAGLGGREDLAAIQATGMVATLAKRIIDGDLPAGVTDRHARRVLLEAKVDAFARIMRRATGQQQRDAVTQHDQAWGELVAWHRDELAPRLTIDSIEDAALEGYRFALDERPVGQLQFSFTGDAEDSGWHLLGIYTEAFATAPDEASRWAGDAWAVDVPGAGQDLAQLAEIKREQGTAAHVAAAEDVVRRTRATALAAAQATVLDHMASGLAKGIGPFQAGGIAGPPSVDHDGA